MVSRVGCFIIIQVQLNIVKAARKWFTVLPILQLPITMFAIDAPFGRFTPSKNTKLLVDGQSFYIRLKLI